MCNLRFGARGPSAVKQEEPLIRPATTSPPSVRRGLDPPLPASLITNHKSQILLLLLLFGCLGASRPTPTPTPVPVPPVLAEVDRIVREGFWDPKLKGVDWKTAVARAARGLAAARTPSERDAVYDALLACLQDSHTFRLPAG